ncbi:hypothetical protein Ancab_035608 [Ancistrocladus abbreviatus]
MATTIEGEERVLAAAQHIVKSLRTSKDDTEDMLWILTKFDNRLSNLSDMLHNSVVADGKVEENNSISRRFESAEKLILRLDSSGSNHFWEESPDLFCDFLAAIDEILLLMKDAEFQKDVVMVDRAETTLQMAMTRLEDEFRHILRSGSVPLDVEMLHSSIRSVSLSFSSNGVLIDGELESFVRDDDGESNHSHNHYHNSTSSSRGKHYCYHERGGSLESDINVDLVDPAVIGDLGEIAGRLIRAEYDKECCQVYSSVRRDVLDDFLAILGVEKLSIEEVQRIEWGELDEKMKKWAQAVKTVLRILKAEKCLCEQIFDGSESIKDRCFVEAAKACVMQMLNFGEAVAIGKRSSEKLSRILDMYDALADALPDLHYLFSDELGNQVCSEAKVVLDALGDAVKGTFKEFEKAVKGEASKKPVHGGEIHPLSRYVMNYVKLLVDYSSTLNSLLETDVDEGDHHPQGDDGDDSREISPIGRRLQSLIGSLETNLEEKAKFYEDSAMECIFLMNNKLYIVQKVKDSELGKLLGDDWVKRRRGLIRKCATNYLRASWSKALSYLRDEGIGGSSSNASKMALKERFKNFNATFEEIYRIQTAWKVPDSQLRAELRISISEKVIPAYRSFLGRFGSQLESGRHAGKYIKYTAEDIEGYLADLFEGTPVVIHHMRRKST